MRDATGFDVVQRETGFVSETDVDNGVISEFIADAWEIMDDGDTVFLQMCGRTHT